MWLLLLLVCFVLSCLCLSDPLRHDFKCETGECRKKNKVEKEKWENGIFLHTTASTLKFFNLQAKIPRFDLLTNQIRRMQKEMQDKTLPPLHLFFSPF